MTIKYSNCNNNKEEGMEEWVREMNERQMNNSDKGNKSHKGKR